MTLSQLLAVKVVRGLAVGRCVNHSRLTNQHAHAHHDPTDKYAGWICIENPRRILKPGSQQVSRIMLEELAHLLSGHGHDDAWRAVMRSMGLRLTKAERKR